MNRMTDLLNKLERRLGTKILNLPPEFNKDSWAKEVIANETLDTFSRYFPNIMRINLVDAQKKGDYYLLDEYIDSGIEIIGVRDIAWDEFAEDSMRSQQAQGYGIYDFLSNNYGLDDIGLLQMRADHMSLFNNGIYVDFVPPNKIKFTSVTGADITHNIKDVPLDLLIKHSDNLMTISPTMLETFESLALADVASYLYNGLKYYEGLETVYANIELKLSDFENAASKREDIVQLLNDAHVSAANKNMPIMLTV